MARLMWSLHAYQIIVPDEQLDLFACQKEHVHAVNRQLELGSQADRTLCGSLLPAQPHWQTLERKLLRTKHFCPQCREIIQAQRKHAKPGWQTA
ncbi:MAG: hypothetical protein GX908_10160 [Gammaproteobacteria bacterium]|nr:hypothetical protein [Gammaproteobacteria bacterium]